MSKRGTKRAMSLYPSSITTKPELVIHLVDYRRAVVIYNNCCRRSRSPERKTVFLRSFFVSKNQQIADDARRIFSYPTIATRGIAPRVYFARKVLFRLMSNQPWEILKREGRTFLAIYSSPEKFCPIFTFGDVVRNFSGQVYKSLLLDGLFDRQQA